MHYEGNVIRPPSEADSIILQITVGCSHNKCTFCGAYKDELFRLKADEVINADLAFAGQYCRRQNKVFLADGDVLVLPQKKLVALMNRIRVTLPWVNRISLYGNAKSILMKSRDDLLELKKLGLHRVYMGLESGCDLVLDKICKGIYADKMIEAARKIRQAGIFLSVTALLGIGGVEHSYDHARDTGIVLSKMEPNQIGVLTLMILPNTPLYEDCRSGRFTLPTARQLLLELRSMVECLELTRTQFQTNHASNYLPINARLNRDKKDILALLDKALLGEIFLKPEHLRVL